MRQQLILASRWLAISAATSAAAFAITSPAQQAAPQDVPRTSPNAAAAADPQDPKQKKQQVVVTAQKQGEESVQDVPRSVTAITEKQIRDAGITSIKDAARYVPNTLVTGFSARRLSFPYFRGVGSGQGDPAVATFVDDVPQLNVSSTNLPFTGLDRVEILRGPSSVLWGRNTIGGAINMISKQPSWEPGGEFGMTFGNYNSTRYDLRATGAVTDETLAVSVDASYEKRDGYTDNLATGNDIDYRENTFGRVQFLWAPDDNNTVRFTVYGEATRDGGFVLTNVGFQPFQSDLRQTPYRVNQDFEGRTNRDVLAGSVVWNHYGNDFDFVSITSAQTWEIEETADFDFSALDAVRRFTDEEETYAYQELRFQSLKDDALASGKKAGMTWLFGVSGFYSDEDRRAQNEFRAGGAPLLFPFPLFDTSVGSFESWSASAFGQIGMHFGNGWEATTALRYDYESKEAQTQRDIFVPSFMNTTTTLANVDRSFQRWLPRASIAYRCCEDFKSYFSVARGFKAGGVNLSAPSGFDSFGTETSWTYELGAKTQWFDDQLSVNAAIFFIDWDDMQLSQFSGTGGFVANAGKSTSQGIELEVAGNLCEDWTVFGTAGYLDTEFDQYVDQFSVNVTGNNLPFAPTYTFGAGSQYTTKLNDDAEGYARIDWFHVGEFFYDAGNLAGDRYNLTNLRVGVSQGRYRFEGFVSNLLDEEYVSIAFQANPADNTAFVGANGAPRTYGLSMRVSF